jgi:aryl-alcohol dehydrogenase-like predicted oxidoreductase
LLTGKYATRTRPATGRLVENARYADRYGLDSDYVTAEKFTITADETGHQPASLAIAWAMAHPAVTAPIIGARNLDQLDVSLAALDIDMTPELYNRIAATSTTPAPANDRTEVQTGRWT